MNWKEVSEEESFSFSSRSYSSHDLLFCSDSDYSSDRSDKKVQAKADTLTVTPGSAFSPSKYTQPSCLQPLNKSFDYLIDNSWDIKQGLAVWKTPEHGQTYPNISLDPWLLQFENLRTYKTKNGHCNVPQKASPPNKRLGVWVNKQRTEFKKREDGKKSSLTDDRVALLEGLGFVWAKRKGVAAWSKRIVELQQFRHTYGHCHVNTKSSLGRWVSVQRYQYRLYVTGEKSTLTSDKVYQLEALGFNWRL